MERNLTETPKRFSLSSFARRWWLIPIAVAATALAGFGAAQLKENNYASSSWIVASSDDGSPGPGRGFDASRLALTYATSLAEDDQLINHIATAIGKSTDEVDDHFTVLNQPDTAALRLRYRDDDPAVAQAGSRAAAEGVVGSQPVASSVTPGTLSQVQVADDPKKGTNLTVLGLILGAALGLGLALILMFAWERADPRVDDPHDAQALTGIPTTRLDDLTPSRASALLERWLALSGKSAPRVTIVPTSKMEPLGGLTAGWLYGLHTDGPALTSDSNGSSGDQATHETPAVAPEPDEQVDEATPWRSRWHRPAVAPSPYPAPGLPTPAEADPGQQTVAVEPDEFRPEHITDPQYGGVSRSASERVTLTAAGQPGSDTGPEVEAIRSDVLVILAQKAVRNSELLDLVETVTKFGRHPTWILMVDSQRKVEKLMDRAQQAGVSLRAPNGSPPPATRN